MKLKFIYHDNKQKGKVIFECYADSILDADKEFEKAMKIDVVKHPYIGCEIKQEKA